MIEQRTIPAYASALAAAGILLFVIAGYAEDAKAPPPDAPATPDMAAKMEGDPYEMNGIRFGDYQDFQSKWQIVTVRFRTDTDEQRFVYANPIAWDALTRHITDYPDGAVFAKIGIMTREDREFTSSKVPSGPARVQFMVRDKKKYAATDGWGYALFAPTSVRLSAEPVSQQTAACAACHEIVPDRGYVFSQPVMFLTGGGLPIKNNPSPASQVSPSALASMPLVFTDVPTANLPSFVRRGLKPDIKTVRNLTGPMQRHLFSGTMNEIMPALIKEAERSGQPAMLIAANANRFVIIAGIENAAEPRDADALSCVRGEKKYVDFSSSIAPALPAMGMAPFMAMPALRPFGKTGNELVTITRFFCEN